MFARKEKIMTHVLTGEVKQRGRGAVQGTRTSVPPTTRAAQHNYSISGHHKRASSRRLFFSALDQQVSSRSPLKHALASVTQLTTACALHLGAFALSPRGEEALCSAVLCNRSLTHACLRWRPLFSNSNSKPNC
ncbi:hypothetical protein ACLKA6_016851 [Drosophila palustris]